MSSGVQLPPFFKLISHARLASSSDEAKALASSGAAAGTLVWALEQSQGHGRQGRSWASPPGNLYASLILRPKVPAAVAAQLSFAAALAVGEACLDAAPDAAIAFKWPNDVLMSGRKLAGILLESEAKPDGGVAWLVIGIGINLVTYPVNAAYPATALSATGADVSTEAMLTVLAPRFLAWHARWDEGRGFAAVRAAWLARAHGAGEAIRVRLPREEFAGCFAGLDEDGALLVETKSGRRRVEAGEVFPVQG
jgi:BirA family transcriptional regulator, biotin operon repressor / biotin---[acetyl-CoA-carboxylase] ligase